MIFLSDDTTIDVKTPDKLYDYITTAERIELDYEMKMVQEFTLESVNNLLQKINNYCVKTEKKISTTIGMINYVLGELK